MNLWEKILIFCLLLILSSKCGFSQTSSHPIMPMDSLLQLVWVVEDSMYVPYNSGVPLITDHYLFSYFDTQQAYDIQNGHTDTFPLPNVEDSLLLFDTKTKITVVNVATGEKRLEQNRKRGGFIGYLSPNVMHDSVLYMKISKSTLQALDLYSGKVKWEVQFDGSIYTKPQLYQDNLIICTKQEIFFINADDGSILWKKGLGGKIASNIEIVDHVAYLWSVGVGLLAFDLEKQEMIWSFHDVEQEFNNYHLILDKDTIYFASGPIYAVNRQDGTLLWKSDNYCAYQPNFLSLAGNYLIFYGGCYDEQPIISAVTKHDGTLYFKAFSSFISPSDFRQLSY